MKELKEYLNQFKEEMPEWLKNYKPGDFVSFGTFLSGRVGYYPGSGEDGCLVEVANKAHCVHSYLYVDYHESKSHLQELIADEHAFNGYHSIGHIEWTEKQLHCTENGNHKYIFDYNSMVNPLIFLKKEENPYTFLEIFERNEDKDDSWGAERFAITFMFADGIMAYYQIFVRMTRKSQPWIILVHDHGFGGNYDKFGRGGLLEAIATQFHRLPVYIICPQTEKPDPDKPHALKHHTNWKGYELVEDVAPVFGGMNHTERHLYVKR